MKDSKDSLQSPQINLNRDYYHSQKHMSEKFQQFLYLEKLKNEEGYKTKFGEGGSSNIQFNGRIEGNGIRQRQFLQEDNDQRRYQEETQDTNKPSYYMQMMKTGLSVVNGSQSIKNTDAFIEILKRHNNCCENRGHSIGYNQSSADEKYCGSLKEQIKSRPTSSSSSFMYVNPLIGINQRNNGNLRFQPLDEDIPEEKEKGRLKKTIKNQKKKIKKK